jgi:hypothetical protein
MADSRTEQILQAIVAVLDAEEKPGGVTVNRSRRQAVKPEELPMLSVYPVQEDVTRARENRLSMVVNRHLLFQVRCRAIGEDEELDPLRQWTVEALHADPSLGGLALEVLEESTKWNAEDASDSDYSVADMEFRVRYVTARDDLTKEI